MLLKADKNKIRQKRHMRVRNRIHGTAERPRLNVFRSLAHIYVQIIDDDKGVTLTAASSMDKGFEGSGGNIEGAKKVGAAIAKKALDAGITEVVFVDYGGYIYDAELWHLLEALALAGLKF